jgi:hypothetical protein
MKIKFYHNVGNMVTVKKTINLWDIKTLEAGTQHIVQSIEFSNGMAHYTLRGCGNVQFHDCDFKKGLELKEFDTETLTISK